jgi:xanthine dehydrogenase YagR molybdenum-binding subunit
LNVKTARSQVIGGMVWGMSQALLEHTSMDVNFGRYTNANFAEYLVPVNADIPGDIEVEFIDERDPHVNVLGVKGIGELAMVGASAAIANAIYHATGKRIRDLPITPDKLL